jgi:hypothetical protein
MVEKLRTLNDIGIQRFKEFFERVKVGVVEDAPLALLTDDATSEPVEPEIKLQDIDFTNRYELGKYLVETLSPLDRHKISRDHRLWNWLALFFFDKICPKEPDGTRKPLRPELYILEKQYDYLRYYKHLIRTPWLAVLDHGENAQILFANARGIRSDIEETLAASQQVLGNPTIIAAAHTLYFDAVAGKPKRGAAGKAAGSPRRLTAFVQQIALTYDIQSCTPAQFASFLPQEFDRFKPKATSAA